METRSFIGLVLNRIFGRKLKQSRCLVETRKSHVRCSIVNSTNLGQITRITDRPEQGQGTF